MQLFHATIRATPSRCRAGAACIKNEAGVYSAVISVMAEASQNLELLRQNAELFSKFKRLISY